MTTMTTEQVLAHYGWIIECQSPYEIRHEDGSFASLQAARIVAAVLCDDAIFEGVTEGIDR